MKTRRLLWTALAGIVLGILGVGWDRVWHSRQPGGEIGGAAEVIEAHWLMILGVVIIFVALAAAVRSIRHPRSAVTSTWIAFVGSLSMVIGFAWDSARHIQGTESSIAHMMIYAGLGAVVIAVLATLVFSRNSSPQG